MSENDDRAEAIARGLVATGTAKAVQSWMGGFIKLFAGHAVHFWIRDDGKVGYRVVNDSEDTEMPASFLDEMAAAGNSPEGLATELKTKLPSPEDDPSIYDDYDGAYHPPGWVNPIRISREAAAAKDEKDKGC